MGGVQLSCARKSGRFGTTFGDRSRNSGSPQGFGLLSSSFTPHVLGQGAVLAAGNPQGYVDPLGGNSIHVHKFNTAALYKIVCPHTQFIVFAPDSAGCQTRLVSEPQTQLVNKPTPPCSIHLSLLLPNCYWRSTSLPCRVLGAAWQGW